MKDIDKLELIENFLAGNLSGGERSEVEKKIATDPSFLKEMEWQKQATEQLADPGMRLFQQKLHAYRKEKKTELTTTHNSTAKIVRMTPVRRVLALAASLALLVAAAVWLLRDPALTNEQVFANNFQLPATEDISIDNTVKGENGDLEKTTAETSLEQALAAYGLKDYTKATEILNTVNEEELTEDGRRAYLFQKGVYHLANGDYDEAFELFGRDDAGRQYARQWYRALIMLKQNRPKDELLKAFSEIASSKVNVTYRDDAAKVLEELKKME